MADEAQDKKIAELSFGSNKAETALNKINESLKNATELAEKANKAFIEMGKNTANISLGGLDSKTLTKQVDSFSKQLDKLQANQIKQQQNVAAFTEKQNQKRITDEKSKNNKIEIEQVKSNLKMQQEAQKQENRIELLHERQSNSAKTMFDRIQNYANTVILTRGILELRQAISETIDEMVQVESSMIQIDRVLNENSLNIDDYRDKLIQLAYDYGNAFDNVSDVTLRLAQAGFDSQESLALTEKTLLALNTAELNATEATDDMVAIMAQWGLMTGDANEEAEQYASIIDKINKVADNFPTTSADILDALKKMSSGFNLAGASIDETIALFVAAEKASQRGGKQIGNALANIQQQLKDAKKLDIAESLGLDFFTDASKTEFKNIIEIFGEMSERMVALKNAGKESSTEMQELLSIFTVFRRNIGAALLGEMEGEASTYEQALKTSKESLGYSLQENTKYMASAEAAQKQLNDRLLQMKTQVWDNGLEGVYRDMLASGDGLIQNISSIIEKFGVLPTAIGTATLAFGLFNKHINAEGLKKFGTNLQSISKAIQLYNNEVKNGNRTLEEFDTLTGKYVPQSFSKYIKGVKDGNASLGGYITKTALATAGQIALNVAVAAGEAAISFGLSLAIQGIVGAIDSWILTLDEAGESVKELNNNLDSDEQALGEYVDRFKSLRENIENSTLSQEEHNKAKKELLDIQNELISKYGDEAKGINLVTGSIEEQTAAINNLAKQDYKKYVQENTKEINKLTKTFTEDISDSFRFLSNIDRLNLGSSWQSIEPIKDIINSIQGLEYQEDFGIKTEGTIKQVLDRYRELYDKVEQYRNNASDEDAKIFDKSLENISSKISEMEKKYSEDYETYQDYLNKKLQYDDNYNDTYEKILKARGDMSNAIIEGDSGKLEEAQRAIADLYKEAIEKAKDDPTSSEGLVELLEKQLDEVNELIDKENIKLKLGIGIDEDSTETLKDNIQEILNQMGDISLEDLSNMFEEANITENMQHLKEVLDESGISVEDFLEYFEALGFTLGEVSTKAEQDAQSIELLDTSLKTTLETLQNYADKYATLRNAQDEYNQTGALTISTLQGLINNDLLQYLSIQNGQLQINAQAMLNLAEGTKVAAIQQLQAAASADIEKVALGDVNSISNIAKGAIADVGTNAATAGTKATTAASAFNSLAAAINNTIMSSEGKLGEGVDLDLFRRQADAIKNTYLGIAKNISSINIRTASYTPQKVSSSSSSSGSSGSASAAAAQAKREAEQAAKEAEKAAEEQYKNNLAKFTDYVSERERLEQRWVNKQKDLGQLSNKDFLYIIQQRIGRYQTYLDELSKMTWINAEDRAKLEKQYTEEIEDLQLDYLKYLEDVLNEQTKAIEDARDERIKAIEDEADAQIDALRKVEDENDRIRDKEDYENKRRSIQEEIDYWSQRTGREAQENLLEAQKELQELDEDWNRTLEDWNLDDQIQAIEDARDAEIKSIEEAAQQEIDALKRVYDEKVKLFSETGQIIYENGVIESNNLYNAYKENFVDKIRADLDSIRNATANTNVPQASAPAQQPPQQQYETYTIKWGDTLTSIARKFGTTIEKILQANPYVTNRNKIYAGRTLQIPKFHEGGEVGGFNKEGYALLKSKEIILKPEWASGIKKLAKLVDKGDFSANNQTINIQGDLVKMEAKIDSKSDADYVVKKAVREIKSKLNIKK